jgi:myosin heavy subunit
MAHDSVLLVDKLLLTGAVEDYEYLNKSRREIDGVDDKEEWNALKVGFHRYSLIGAGI